MNFCYDLHIHSALSPCGDEDMTPNNIVNMALIKGLDMIAVTDHNSAQNIRAVTEVASGQLKVVPGIEVTTAEEVHTVCYFPDIESAEDMGKLLKEHLPPIKNRPEIFGRQLVMDKNDEIVAEEDVLLINATDLDIYEVQKETKKRGGWFVPAHIDRSSYSVISNLGFIPPDLEFDALEITAKGLEEYYKRHKNQCILTSSDAHYLENITESEDFFDINVKMPKKIPEFLYKFFV